MNVWDQPSGMEFLNALKTKGQGRRADNDELIGVMTEISTIECLFRPLNIAHITANDAPEIYESR